MQIVKEDLFDVAISFAGQQRILAKTINNILKDEGFSTFYDSDHTIDLWGKNLSEHLPTIYSSRARYVLILASQEYFQKIWPRVERRAAVSKMIRSDVEYLLIYKIGDLEIPSESGISPDISYLPDSLYSPEDVALGLKKKLMGGYLDEEIVSEITTFANALLAKEFFEKNFMNGILPNQTIYWRFGEEVPRATHDRKRWGTILQNYLETRCRQGLFMKSSGFVIGYGINPEFTQTFGVIVDTPELLTAFLNHMTYTGRTSIDGNSI